MKRKNNHSVRTHALMSFFLWTMVQVSGIALLDQVHSAIFDVTSTIDSGTGSLREAISDANVNAGRDTVNFQIGVVGSAQQILLLSPLPTITDTLVIDGWTQGGLVYEGPPLIELDGSNAGNANGLTISTEQTLVRGLIVNRFGQSGISLNNGGSNRIVGNYIGTNAAGTANRGNGHAGISVSNSQNNSIGGVNAAHRNILSANDMYGMELIGAGAIGNVVEGNYIGADAAGNVALGNTVKGIWIDAGASNNTIGGTATGAGNLISGNGNDGIEIETASCENNVIQGNLIGTNADATAAIPNGNDGIESWGMYTLIGGTSPGARNVISGNGSRGLHIMGDFNVIYGNYIGTDATGSYAIGNSNDGIVLHNFAFAEVGDTLAGAGNLISGNNDDGIHIRGGAAAHNVIRGNYIGVDVSGITGLGNGGHGIHITSDAFDNTIGGSSANEGNVIAHNGGAGVSIPSGTGTTVRANSVFSNALLGIDLRADGVTQNDSLDQDSGPNHLQNFPIVEMVISHDGSTFVQGKLNSTTDRDFAVELFSNANPDPSGFGEGESFFVAFTAHTNSVTGDAVFSRSFPGELPDGYYATATATDLVSLETSEFGPTLLIVNADIDLSSTLDSGSLMLEWSAVAAASAYWVYGAANAAYFVPELQEPFGSRLITLPSGTTTWASTNGIGNLAENWTYLVIAVDQYDQEIARSNRTGEFDIGL